MPAPSLDGTWDMTRSSGLLPPLLGVRKEIRGTEGSTILLHRAAGAPFDVVGLELHYRRPFVGFVDVLEPAGAGFEGRSTFRGRTFGHFRMTATGGGVVTTVQTQLIAQLDEAYAMEQNVLRVLDETISALPDEELRQEVEHHREETVGHGERLRARLAAHGSAPSAVRQVGGVVGAVAKLPLDLVRGQSAGRSVRDAYAAEHLEIATYELLTRVAARAGDDESVQTCEEILAQERTMAEALARSWDRVVDLSLGGRDVAAS